MLGHSHLQVRPQLDVPDNPSKLHTAQYGIPRHKLTLLWLTGPFGHSQCRHSNVHGAKLGHLTDCSRFPAFLDSAWLMLVLTRTGGNGGCKINATVLSRCVVNTCVGVFLTEEHESVTYTFA